MCTEFPKYIRLKNADDIRWKSNALKLIGSKDNKAIYWRHGGCYSADAKYENGKLMVYIASCKPCEYIKCTEEEWKESNGQYASEEYDHKFRKNR